MIEDHEWTKEQAGVIKALWEDPHGNYALTLIAEVLCEKNRIPLVSGNPDLTAFNCGKQWLARQLQNAIATPMDRLIKEDHGTERLTGTNTATSRATGNTKRARNDNRRKRTDARG